jgi:isopentenyl-diphosphate Delta-isomerase
MKKLYIFFIVIIPFDKRRGYFQMINMDERLILVNEHDEIVGFSEKMETHTEGKLHRAFSIFVFNKKGHLLLQKRAKSKYHSGGLWSNTCCGHPRPGEATKDVAHRRLKEEMGFDCELEERFSFTYKAKINEFYENEYDHVFIGIYDGEPSLNANEVESWKWMSLMELIDDSKKNSEDYTYWLNYILHDSDLRKYLYVSL